MSTVINDELLRLQEVEGLVGLRKSRIYRLLAEPNSGFPRPCKIGASSRFSKREIMEYIAARLAERNKPRGA